MPINLSKGQKVSLTKGNPRLKKIMVGLGWDVNAFDSGADFDLDASVFMLGSNGKCPTDKEFIFYGRKPQTIIYLPLLTAYIYPLLTHTANNGIIF